MYVFFKDEHLAGESTQWATAHSCASLEVLWHICARERFLRTPAFMVCANRVNNKRVRVCVWGGGILFPNGTPAQIPTHSLSVYQLGGPPSLLPWLTPTDTHLALQPSVIHTPAAHQLLHSGLCANTYCRITLQAGWGEVSVTGSGYARTSI